MKIKFLGFYIAIENRRRVFGHCETCHWWDLQYAAPGESKGHCHRLAPVTDQHGRTLWPRTTSRQSCGQFTVKPKVNLPPAKGGAK